MTEDAYLQEIFPEPCADSIPARGDRDFFCMLKTRTVLIVDDVCYSRTRNCNCQQCVFDRDGFVIAQLVWLLTDMVEDKWSEETRRVSKK